MLKTIKGKVIAGTVSVTLLAGAGAAFASSNAGQNLQNWYNSQYSSATTDVSNQSYTYASGKVSGLLGEYNGLKSAATTSINETRDSSTTRVNNVIESEKQAHIAAINSQKAQISEYMATQFDGLSTYASGLIEQAGADAVTYADQNLGTHTTTVGGEAVSKLSTDVGAASDAAVTALETAISNAQSELEGQLASETTATVEEIKGMIDAKIIDLREEITAIKDGLVVTQQGLINEEARAQLKAAKEALQTVVDNM